MGQEVLTQTTTSNCTLQPPFPVTHTVPQYQSNTTTNNDFLCHEQYCQNPCIKTVIIALLSSVQHRLYWCLLYCSTYCVNFYSTTYILNACSSKAERWKFCSASKTKSHSFVACFVNVTSDNTWPTALFVVRFVTPDNTWPTAFPLTLSAHPSQGTRHSSLKKLTGRSCSCWFTKLKHEPEAQNSMKLWPVMWKAAVTASVAGSVVLPQSSSGLFYSFPLLPAWNLSKQTINTYNSHTGCCWSRGNNSPFVVLYRLIWQADASQTKHLLAKEKQATFVFSTLLQTSNVNLFILEASSYWLAKSQMPRKKMKPDNQPW